MDSNVCLQFRLRLNQVRLARLAISLTADMAALADADMMDDDFFPEMDEDMTQPDTVPGRPAVPSYVVSQ